MEEQKQLTLSPSNIEERSIPSAFPLRETGLYRFQNMLKMKCKRFVKIRIPASCGDSRQEERSASGFDPALQTQPRILGWTFFSDV